jgi:endoglucanase
LKYLPGVVVQPPGKLLPESLADRPIPLEHLLVDVGLEPGRVTQLVRVGDPVSFASEPVELAGGLLSGHSLDNRASVAALTVCLEELRSRTLAWDVWAVATVQEEIGLVGAATSSFQIKPDIAIAVDTTYGKGPGADDWNTFGLGSGPTLGWGAEIHPFLYKEFKELADRLGIPSSMEIMPIHSGTDAYAMQMAADGIPCFVLGIPIRYMHTPVEVVAPIDILRTGRLLSEFIARLEPGFLDRITWDDGHA